MLNNIRVRRIRANKTQEDLARILDVRTATFNSIENGKTVPSVRFAMQVARYFNVTMDELFTWEPEDDAIAKKSPKRKLPSFGIDGVGNVVMM